MAVFSVVVPCSLVQVHSRFRGTCCLHHHGDHYNPEDSHLHGHRMTTTNHTTSITYINIRHCPSKK
jgi:hypothetical protein